MLISCKCSGRWIEGNRTLHSCLWIRAKIQLSGKGMWKQCKNDCKRINPFQSSQQFSPKKQKQYKVFCRWDIKSALVSVNCVYFRKGVHLPSLSFWGNLWWQSLKDAGENTACNVCCGRSRPVGAENNRFHLWTKVNLPVVCCDVCVWIFFILLDFHNVCLKYWHRNIPPLPTGIFIDREIRDMQIS